MPASWQPPDLDEIRTNLFVINNEKVRPWLRGEGERDGRFFRLRTQRRDGWVARVRTAGFNVRTLRDRINALPAIAPGVEPGPEGMLRLGNAREQVATWDPMRLRWRDCQAEEISGARVVRVRDHEPLRRRRGRGPGDYFIAQLVGSGQINLRPVRERDAIVQAYALLASTGTRPRLPTRPTLGGLLVVADHVVLPEPHREALQRLAVDEAEQWTFEQAQLDMVKEVFATLGLDLDLPG